jgi:hypothetical protein
MYKLLTGSEVGSLGKVAVVVGWPAIMPHDSTHFFCSMKMDPENRQNIVVMMRTVSRNVYSSWSQSY